MRPPEFHDWDDASQRPCPEEIRQHARNLLEFSCALNEFADSIERGKNTVKGYWQKLEIHQKNLHDLYKEFTE